MADDNKLYGFGNIASSAVNAGLGLYSLHHQKKENEKTREYNLKLAQMQNQWNVEQWQRENDYNMPANQVARIKAAGLNPDLLYGGGIQNTSATSPQMTAGVAGTPMDWSSLANLRLTDAQARKLNAEASLVEKDSRVRDEQNMLGLEVQAAQRDYVLEMVNKTYNEARKIDYEGNITAFKDAVLKKFGDEIVQNYLDKLSAETDIVKNQLEYDIQTLVDRIAGVSYETSSLAWTAEFEKSQWNLLFQIIEKVLPNGSDLLKSRKIK